MELSPYTNDDYARRFLQGQSIFQDDSRLFHRTEYTYDYVAGITSARAESQAVHFDLLLSSGGQAELKITSVKYGVLRLQMGLPGATYEEESPMLLLLPAERPPLTFREEDASYVIGSFGYRLVLDKSPFCLKVLTIVGETIFESETELLVSLLTAPPMGFRTLTDQPGTAPMAFMSWRTGNRDRYYGLGEKFTRFEKTGTRSVIWQADTCGSNTSDMSYKAVPALFSTAGWGLLAHTSYRSHWEIGAFSYATAAFMVEEPKLDVFLMLAPSLYYITQLYTGLTGRPSLPPKWAFGMWMSRAPYRSRQQLEEVAARLRAEQIPCDVFNIDPDWEKKTYYGEIGVEICNFEWNHDRWPEPEQMFAGLAEQGFKVCLWINPYFSEDCQAYAEARANGYLVKTVEGKIARLEFGLAAGIVDLTNPDAKRWWQEKLKALLRQGVAVFKVDFGDRVPENALFANGKTGQEMHNLFVHLYAQAVYEAVEEVKGVGMIWRRPGYIGSQRYPGSWAGDTQVTWEGMQGALRGGLSAAFTGEAFWGHDIGGFVGPKPSDELYIRWAQFGMFSPLARFHGITPREPWNFGEEALKIVRHYTELRYRLVPYLLASAADSVAYGLPMLRPLVIEFQDEPGVDAIDDQYLLGSDLLVAPIFRADAQSRWVYIPDGQWRPLEHAFDGKASYGVPLDGPGYRQVAAPLDYLPVFVRPGAVIPYYVQALQHLQGPTPFEWGLDLYPGLSQRSLKIAETDFDVQIDYHFQNGAGRLAIAPVPIHFTVRWVGFPTGQLRLKGAVLTRQIINGVFQVTLDAAQGINLTFSCPL